MGIDFIAIDFETATSDLNSACSVGIVAVDDLEIVDSFYSLIKPPNLYFQESNVRIHKITPNMVERAPSLDELWPEINWMFASHCPVVAHNAHFDMSVLRQSTSADILDFPFVDSMSIASPIVQGSRSLAHCAQELNINLNNHHNALADAEASAKIAICGLQDSNCIFMWEYLAKNPHVHIHYFKDLLPQQTIYTKKKKATYPTAVRPSDVCCSVEHLDIEHPLYGKSIVFTGELSIGRKEAMQLAVNVGAIVKSAISKKTDFLIVGWQDTTIVGEDGMSTKEKQAYDLINSGKADIKIIGETEFVSLVNGKELVLNGST